MSSESGGGELQGPDFEAGVAVGQLPEGRPFLGHVGGEAVVLVKQGQSCFALSATCTHYSGPLAEGLVVGDTIRCPWHHARFDLATGAPRGGPGINPLGCFEVRREGDLIKVGGKRAAGGAEGTARSAGTKLPDRVIVVGSGPAGLMVADTLRAGGFAGSITMVGQEGIPVDRPNLSKDYLAGTAPEEWLPLRTEEALRDKQIDLVAAPALRLDLSGKRLTVEGRGELPFDALVLATGATPVRLPIPGAELPQVFVLRTLADSRAIIAAAGPARRAVVIGGGFIGLEVAASLRTRGLGVTVVLREALPLQKILGQTLATFVRDLHQEHGVTFTRGTPASIDAGGVTLADGQRLEGDLVVMGVGVRPRVDLGEGAGLRVDDGIVVDDRLRASAPGVFAVGDVARSPYGPEGRLIRVEHFVQAERMGFVAARNLLGHDLPFRHTPFFWSQHYDVPIAYVGAGPFDDVQVLGDAGKRDVLAVFRAGGRAVALASIYRDQDSLRFEALREENDDPGLETLIAEAHAQLGG